MNNLFINIFQLCKICMIFFRTGQYATVELFRSIDMEVIGRYLTYVPDVIYHYVGQNCHLH